jgi:ribosomal protein L37AE/L43A
MTTKQKKVVDKEAYDEQVPYSVWICNGCGKEFDSEDALLNHFDDVDNGVIPDHATNYSVDTRYKTVHHDEEFHYETVTKHVCKVCGHVKED